MGAHNKGRNKHQKAAHRPGEQRVGRDEIDLLLTLSRSDDPEDRAIAATYMCPCHVRRRIDEVWQALYRMMEDPDVRVRRAAWHTLEDGGCPTDPALDPIFDRALASESDRQVRRFVEMFAGQRQAQNEVELQRRRRSEYLQRGRCDFCGEENVPIKRDFDTEIALLGGASRLAWTCDECSNR